MVLAGGYSPDGTTAHQAIWAIGQDYDTWQVIGQLPHAMGAFGFAAIDDDIFLVGGAFDMLGGHPTDEVWRWDPDSDSWSACAPLPAPREHLAMAAHDGSLYAVGGRVHGQASPDLGASLTIYDPGTDTWVSGSSLSPPRSGLNGASTCSGVVVVGGETPTEVFDAVNLLDPATGSWQQLPHLPTAVHGVAVAALDDWLYVMGGSTKAGTIMNIASAWKLPLTCAER